MSKEDILGRLKKELSEVPQDGILNYIKARIKSIEDPEEKRIVENLYWIIANSNPTIANSNPTQVTNSVVILIHGIRTHAIWHDSLKTILKSKNKVVYPIKYGYFDLIRFWFPFPWFIRTFPIKHATREFRQIKARHPNDEITVVAHSFGTYIVSKMLSNETDLQIDRLLLCGSIVRDNFRWDKLPNFPSGNVINDCGTRDYYPLLAKSTTWGYGASGTFGFNTHLVEDRYHDAGHSDFFTDEIMNTYWLPFIEDGTVVTSDWSAKRSNPPWIASISSLFQGQIIIIILMIIVYFIFFF